MMEETGLNGRGRRGTMAGQGRAGQGRPGPPPEAGRRARSRVEAPGELSRISFVFGFLFMFKGMRG
jgi:hypothetical protein